MFNKTDALLTITSQLELSSITAVNAGIYSCHFSIIGGENTAAATVLAVYG